MIKFTDARPFIGSETYLCPNECIITLRELAARIGYKMVKGASIASGGEVPLTVVLPYVDDLKIVDHNYGSLFWTCMKILMLKHLTNDQIKALFEQPHCPSGGGYGKDFRKFCMDVRSENPIKPEQYGSDADFAPPYAKAFVIIQSNWQPLARFWLKEITSAHMDAARERLDCIEVIHGDLRDVGTDIDLLYTSNALGHRAHDGAARNILAAQVADTLLLSGTLLSTHNGGEHPPVANTVCDTIKSCKCGNGHMGWQYWAHRKVKPLTASQRFCYMSEPKVLQHYVKDTYWGTWSKKPMPLPKSLRKFNNLNAGAYY